MSFTLFTDSCSNLPGWILGKLNIQVLPCQYTINNVAVAYNGDIETFDAHGYYNQMRAGAIVTTSLLNTQTFLDFFRPVLEAGQDIVYVGLSGGISGTIQAATIAAAELKEEFEDRIIRIVDSMGAGLGTGLLTCLGADLRNEGMNADETADKLDTERMNLCEYFTVDDLRYLRKTGRISAAAAAIGSVLNIKPLLRGDESGHIVNCAKLRGRKKAVEAILTKYAEKIRNAEVSRVAISHGDCPEEAELLAERVRQIAEPKELIICPHEPFTGAHVGPGMLAVFFFGNGR